MKLENMTWPEVAAMDRGRTLVVVPIAACEQHGHHLPTFTDSLLCRAVAERVEESMEDAILLTPTLWLGASAHHRPFGATLSLREDTHAEVLCQLLEPLLADRFTKVLVLNGHGGNIDTMHVALRMLQPRFPDAVLAGASYWEMAEEEIAKLVSGPRKTVGHAGEVETALMMHFHPKLVRTEVIADDGSEKPTELRGVFVAKDFRQRSRRGAVGYPTYADASIGHKLADAIVRRVKGVCSELLGGTGELREVVDDLVVHQNGSGSKETNGSSGESPTVTKKDAESGDVEPERAPRRQTVPRKPFNDAATWVMQLANQEAQRFNHQHIGTEHVLLGLVKEGSGRACKTLAALGADYRNLRHAVERLVEPGDHRPSVGRLPRTEHVQQAIAYAAIEAEKLGASAIATEHLLIGVLQVSNGVAVRAMRKLGLSPETVRQEALRIGA